MVWRNSMILEEWQRSWQSESNPTQCYLSPQLEFMLMLSSEYKAMESPDYLDYGAE